MSLLHDTGPREGPPVTKEVEAHDTHGSHHLLADRRCRRVACWGYHKGGRLWPRRQYRGRRYWLADRRLVVWPIGHRCWWTDRINHRRSRRCDHPPRHCRADQASVARRLMVGRWAGTKAFLPRRVLHARENEDQAPKGPRAL